MDWIIHNWIFVVLALLVADKVVALTPCKWDDLIVTSIKQSLCKITGKTMPVTLIAIGLTAQVAMLCPGCAVKTIADLPPRDQALATTDLLIDQYTDLHAAYATLLPSLSADRQYWCKTTLAPAMNVAKRAIKLATDAAIIWKLTPTGNATSRSDTYAAALAEARAAMDDALSLYNIIASGGAS